MEVEAGLKGRTRKRWHGEFYVHSSHWGLLRDAKLRLSPRCEFCDSSDQLQVHHENYRDIYDVAPEDLTTVCRECRTREHGRKYEKTAKLPIRISRRQIFIPVFR